MSIFKKGTAIDLAAKLAQAHTDLSTFHAIIAVIESGAFSPDSQADQFRIVKMCNAAAGRCLRRHDRLANKLATISPRERDRAEDSNG